jgi:teichuronic acid biosynthesis glycosyltransferase TuaC
MKVLSILAATKNPLGMIFSHQQIRSLEKLGIENQSFFIPADGLTFLKLIKSVSSFRKVIREYDPDVIHAHFGVIYSFVGAFATLRPLVITFHGSDINSLPQDSIFRRIKKKVLSNLSVLRARKIICVSDRIRDNLWWGRSKADVIPLGIDTKKFTPVDRDEARKALRWSIKELIILFNANSLVKRLDIAEKTVQLIRKSFPGARLVTLDGEHDPEMIPMMLNASDCLLLCSDSEGSPMMVKEAMACNVPVVGVDVGDVKERLHGVVASVVVEKEPEALAKAIVGIVQNGMRSNGREKLIADNLSEEKVAQTILQIYRRVSGK